MAKKNQTEDVDVITVDEEKPYQLCELQARHLFLLTRVVSSLGIKKLADIFNNKVDVAAIANAENEDVVREVGYGTVIEIVGLVIENLPNCQDDLFKFLAAISNLNEKQIGALPLGDFVNMVSDVVRKKEFRDFFTQCAKFLQ